MDIRRPGTPLNSPCQEVGFICPFVVIDPTDLGATTAIPTYPGRRIPAFLPFGIKASRVSERVERDRTDRIILVK